jgi:tetratricopeptide (TPR) repeat protein
MKNICLAALALILALTVAYGAQQTFVREYTYEAGEADSKLSSRATALEQVKRALLEELGTYLESYTEVKNSQLTLDQITAMTAGVVQTQILDEKWDGREYWLKAKVEADPAKVAADLENMKLNQGKMKELEELKRKADLALAENERLKKELESAKGDQARQQIQQTYTANANRLSAKEWFERGSFLTAVENYAGAVEAYSKGLGLDPGFAPGFYNRGYAYNMLGRHQEAIEDYDRSIKLDPEDAQSHFNRALSNYFLGNQQQAVADYGQAIALNPGDPQAYYNRAMSNLELGQPQRAAADMGIAAKMGFGPAQQWLLENQ